MFATKLKESREKMCDTQRNFDDKGGGWGEEINGNRFLILN